MIKPSLWLDAATSECPVNEISQEVYVCDVLFSHCDSGCKNCPVLPGQRFMKADEVIAAINQAVDFAVNHGFFRVLIRLVGGDTLRRKNELQTICEWVDSSRKTWSIPVLINAVICGTKMNGSIQSFLCKHQDYLRLTYRWNGSQGLSDWNKYYIFKHNMCSKIDWSVTTQTLPLLSSEVYSLLEYGKNVCLEYPDLSDWDEQKLHEFQGQLYNLLALIKYNDIANVHFKISHSCFTNNATVSFVNIDSKHVPCRYFSSERLLFSASEKALQNLEYRHDTSCPISEFYSELRLMHSQIYELLELFSSVFFGEDFPA